MPFHRSNVQRKLFRNDPARTQVVSLTDDGKGLQKARPDSVGITGMRERASRIGAQVAVANRSEGRGTTVTITLGLDPGPSSDKLAKEDDRPDTAKAQGVADSARRVPGRRHMA